MSIFNFSSEVKTDDTKGKKTLSDLIIAEKKMPARPFNSV